jgi:TPR repeat protein
MANKSQIPDKKIKSKMLLLDTLAQYLLGLRYYEGEEVEKDISMALEWFEQAVDQGVIEAQNLIAKIQKRQ